MTSQALYAFRQSYIHYTATFKQGSPWGVSNMKAASNGQYYLLKHFFTMLASRSALWAKKSLKQCFFKNPYLLLILSLNLHLKKMPLLCKQY